MDEKAKIMIVDGDKDVRSSLYNALNQEGYAVVTVSTGEDALKQAKDGIFDVLITEMKMPDMSGIEVIRKFKQTKADACIIVLTAYGSVNTAVKAMREGAYDYITKPFNADEIRLIIRRALERQALLRAAKEKEIFRELAILDGLTEVYNRRYFDEMLIRELNRAKRYLHPLSLMMIDIDDFKKYNDAYGHPAGDKVLKQIGKVLLGATRNVDLVARYGGEEFSIILPETSKMGGSVLATRFLSLVEISKVEDEKSLFGGRLTISMGLATYPEDAKDKEELISKADSALYQAKRLGKNRICLFGLKEGKT